MIDSEKERTHAGVENGWICVAAFAAPHGVKGAVRLKSFTDNTAAIFDFADLRDGPNGKPVSISKQGANKDSFVVRVEGVASPEAAKTLKGVKLWTHRDVFKQTDEDEFYLADLIGLTAFDTQGTRLGVVNAVENFGAEDLIELVLDTPIKGLGRYAFIPFRMVFVPEINISAGALTVNVKEWVETQVLGTPETEGDSEDIS